MSQYEAVPIGEVDFIPPARHSKQGLYLERCTERVLARLVGHRLVGHGW